MLIRPRTFGWAALCVLAVGAVLLLPSLALAQGQAAPEPLRPPQPGTPPSAPTLMMYICLALILAAVGFAAAFPVKRGHQD